MRAPLRERTDSDAGRPARIRAPECAGAECARRFLFPTDPDASSRFFVNRPGIAGAIRPLYFPDACACSAAGNVNITVFLAVGAALRERRGSEAIEFTRPRILERTEAIIFFLQCLAICVEGDPRLPALSERSSPDAMTAPGSCDLAHNRRACFRYSIIGAQT